MSGPYQPPKSIVDPPRERSRSNLPTSVRMIVSVVGAVSMGLFLYLFAYTPFAIIIFVLPAIIFGITYWFQIKLSPRIVMNAKLGALTILSAIAAGIVFIPACTFTSIVSTPLFEAISPSVAYAPPVVGMAISTLFWAFVFCELGGYTLTRSANTPEPSSEEDFSTDNEESSTKSDS